MILRKPYAFLIKNFKKFHFILFIAMIYIIYTSNRVSTFFNKYDKTREVIFNNSLSEEYVSISMFIVGLVIIAISVFIYILMRQKNKPRWLYSSIIIYYFLVLILFMVDSSGLNAIQSEGMSPQTVRVFRDVNFISLVIQTFFALLVVIRAVGFDIKKFNFGEDIEDLKIEVTDNEEFELTSGINTDEVKRKYRRQVRELGYFYEENKKIIWSIFIILILSFGFIYFYQTQVSNKIYNQTDTVNINNLYLKINNVYSTKLNYKGINIAGKNYTYVIVDINTDNKYSENRKLNMDNLKIVVKDNIYEADITKYEYFRDIAAGYINQDIIKNTSKDYIVVFKLKEEDINKEMILRYADYINFNNKGLNTKYIKFKITPTSLDTMTDYIKAELNKEIYYGLSLLKETKLKITAIDINNKFRYTNNNAENYVVEPLSTKTILKISYDFNLDKSITYISTIDGFLSKFCTIKYKVGNNYYNANYTNITPTNYKSNDIYLSVDKRIENASSIELIATIRNKRYTYTLK